MSKRNTGPLLKNEYVKELLAIMEENQLSTMKDLVGVLDQVGAMERQLEAAVNELQNMKQALAEAQAQNHPVKTAMQKAVIVMQDQVLQMRDKLSELKGEIIEGCKNAVSAFEENGISALNNIARFFKVKPILEKMRAGLDKDIQFDDKAIAKIEAISAEYHEAGLHLKNMGRAFSGKEAAQEAKPSGNLSKTLSAPYRAERSCFIAMKRSAEKAIGGLARLEEKAAARKPSIKKTMQELNEQIMEAQKSAPTPERPRPATHDR